MKAINSWHNPFSRSCINLQSERSRNMNVLVHLRPARTRIKTLHRSDDESKRLHKKRHRNRERREVSSLDSIDSDTSYCSHMVKFSQVRDSVGSAYSSESESTGADISEHVSRDSIESLYSESTVSRGKFF